MKRSSTAAFTLVEMLTVMAVIVILVSLVLGVNTLAQQKAASQRAIGEIATFGAACENYRVDNGAYPRKEGVTEPDGTSSGSFLDPRKDATPGGTGATALRYQKAAEFLYIALSGDTTLTYKPTEGIKSYLEFKPNMITATKTNGKISKVKWMQDPWGNPYGYSTGNARQEEDFAQKLRTNPNTPRETPVGYSNTFDLWSTGGSNSDQAATSGAPGPFRDSPKWVKTW